MRWLAVVAACTVLAGCADRDPRASDGAPAAEDATPAPGAGLAVQFLAHTPIPADIDGDLRIEEVHLSATSVRAIGDAGPGDVRTTQPGIDLTWTATESPLPFEFGEAPSGLYSQVELRIASHGAADDRAFAIRGQLRVAGAWRPFLVESVAGVLPARIDITTMLAPGGRADIAIAVDFAAVVAPIDWRRIEPHDDVFEVRDAHPAMPVVRAALAAAFAAR